MDVITYGLLNSKIEGSKGKLVYDEDRKCVKVEGNIGIGIDADLSETSTNAVQNKVITAEINELKNSVSNGKTLVANAITDKGVATEASDSFETMAEKILQISGGGSSNIIVDLTQSITWGELFNGMNIPFYPNAMYHVESLDNEINDSNVSMNSVQFGFKNGQMIAQPLGCYRLGSNSPYSTLILNSGVQERWSTDSIVNDNGVLKYTLQSNTLCKGRWICSIANFDE